MMTLQEIFDKAATHLIAQGVRSETPGGPCRYRGPEGRMCAAGPFIPEDKYEPRFEGHAVVTENYPYISSELKKDALDATRAMGIEPFSAEARLLRGCQMIHDEARDGSWHTRLEQLAAIWGLNTNALAAAVAKRAQAGVSS